MTSFRVAVAILGLSLFSAPSSAQEIIVLPDSSAKPGSEFLRPPGSSTDSYAPTPDWNTLPPWKQTEFFGIRAKGQVFVFVVDCSGSMGDGDRLIRAKRELRKTIGALRFPQRFHVIFYNDGPISMPGGPLSPDLDSKSQLRSFLDIISADGGTDPRAAMGQALELKPDAIFLLSDGQYPKGSVAAIRSSNPKKIPIHCVDLLGSSSDLRAIARESGGQYASRP